MNAQITVAGTMEPSALPFLRHRLIPWEYRPRPSRQRDKFDRSKRTRHQAEFASNAPRSVHNRPSVDSRNSRHLADIAARRIHTVMALYRSRKVVRNHDEKPRDKNTRNRSSCIRLCFGVNHGTRHFTGSAPDALFGITLNERAGLFRSQFHTPRQGWPSVVFLLCRCFCGICLSFLRNSPGYLRRLQPISIHIQPTLAATSSDEPGLLAFS
jgi:hypothetical protein